MTRRPPSKFSAKKKRVEYRWFVSTPECGLLGGIVARTKEDALSWGVAEMYAERKGARLIRVRMEYELIGKT